MNDEIESIIADFEWWVDLLDGDPSTSMPHDFAVFCYAMLPKVIDAFKQSQQEQSTSTPGIIS